MSKLYRLIFENEDNTEFESAFTRTCPKPLNEILKSLILRLAKDWNWRLVEA